jgi:PBP1b-binding outer membrane lipoprotein LpoB
VQLLFREDSLMRALISLFAAALLFAAGCSKTNDNADNPTPPADQSATPSTMPPPDQAPPATPSDSTMPPPTDQPTPPEQQAPPQQ